VASVAAPVHSRALGVDVALVDVAWRDDVGQEQHARVAARLDYVSPGQEDVEDDPEVSRARDERILRVAQEIAEARARHGDFEGARQALRDALDRICDQALCTFVRQTLLPCYEDRSQYTHTSSMRASSLTALRGGRQVTASKAVAELFNVEPTSVEQAMERSFREGGNGRSGRKPDPGKK
jgi:hypothetical protein